MSNRPSTPVDPNANKYYKWIIRQFKFCAIFVGLIAALVLIISIVQFLSNRTVEISAILLASAVGLLSFGWYKFARFLEWELLESSETSEGTVRRGRR